MSLHLLRVNLNQMESMLFLDFNHAHPVSHLPNRGLMEFDTAFRQANQGLKALKGKESELVAAALTQIARILKDDVKSPAGQYPTVLRDEAVFSALIEQVELAKADLPAPKVRSRRVP